VVGAGASPAQVKQARAAKAAGDYAKALQLLASASPQDTDAQWLKAWILAEQGKKAEATAAFNAFLATAKPNDARVAEAKAALKRLGAGTTAALSRAGEPLGAPKSPGPK